MVRMSKMNDNWPVVRHYLVQVRKALHCSNKDKRYFLTRLYKDVEDYASEKCKITEEDLFVQFGPPVQLASEYLETVDSERLEQYRMKSSHRMISSLVLLLMLLICTTGGFYWYSKQPLPGDEEITPEMAEDVNASHCMFDFLVRSYCRRFGNASETETDNLDHVQEGDEKNLYQYLYQIGVTPDLIKGTTLQTKFVRGTHGLGYKADCTNQYIEGYISWFNDPNEARMLILYTVTDGKSQS